MILDEIAIDRYQTTPYSAVKRQLGVLQMAQKQSQSPTFSLVLPILNPKCKIPSAVPVLLSPDIALRKIRPDDLATITEDDRVQGGYLKGSTYTITIDNFDHELDEKRIRALATSALFSINILSDGHAISTDRAFLIRSLRKRTLHDIKPLHFANQGNQSDFVVKNGTDLSYSETLFSSVTAAIEKHKPLLLTISRFNSAIGRLSQEDRLVDLCISLESVFQSSTEISFQFALYNALLSESDPQKREEIFKLLKKLYNFRSKLVHGSGDLNESWMEENWSKLLSIAKASILQKIDFLTTKNHDDWKSHLESLALGVPHE